MFLRSCCFEGTDGVASDQVTDMDGAPGVLMSEQQHRHEQDIIQLQQHPHDSQPAPSSTGGGRDASGARGADKNGGTAGEGYPKTRVITPDRQQNVQVDGGVAASQKVHKVADGAGETTHTGSDGTEGDGGHSQGADGQDKPSGPTWNGESSHGETQGKDEPIRFDASRHKGIGGQDSSAGSRPVDATNRVVHNYEPVIDSDDGGDREPVGHWDPSSRHKTPENYDPSSVAGERPEPDHSRDYLNRGNVVADKATAGHSDDANDGSDSADYSYRYYKLHHPGSVDAAPHAPVGGYDRGYMDKGPWRKTGRFGAGDARPIGRTYGASDTRPGAGSDRNRAGYNYYPRNNDYDNYYDNNNGKKGYYGNSDGVLLPYRHHEVFDYYAPETGTTWMSFTVAFVSLSGLS